MSKKIIFNDNELVTNEDVEQGIDWRGRDLYRWLEGFLQNTFGSDPGTGMIEGGAIISGLEMTLSPTNLDVTITPGSALMAIGGEDVAFTNSFQMGSSESDVVLSLPVADAALFRWDLIECSVSQVVTRESRQVLSTGPLRTLSPTDVDKLQENVLQFRVRSGSPDTSTNAMLPFLGPDPAWIPLFAVRVDPGRVTLLTGVGATQNAQTFDLRKLLSRARPDSGLAHGFQYPVTLSITAGLISSHRNWVQTKNYNSPVGVGHYIDITAGRSGPPVPTRPLANVNTDKAAFLTLAVDRWYYIYAFRPHNNSGYTSMFLSDIVPNTATGSPTGGAAALALALPAPFKPDVAPSQYMGAVRLVQSGALFLPRGFRQNSGYVSMGTISRTGLAGAVFNSEILSGGVPTGSTTVNLIGADSVLTVPPHCRMARIAFDMTGGVAGSGITFFSYEDYAMYTTSLVTGEKEQIILDVPLDFSSSGVKEFGIEVTGSALALVRAYVLGYYEEMP